MARQRETWFPEPLQAFLTRRSLPSIGMLVIV